MKPSVSTPGGPRYVVDAVTTAPRVTACEAASPAKSVAFRSGISPNRAITSSGGRSGGTWFHHVRHRAACPARCSGAAVASKGNSIPVRLVSATWAACRVSQSSSSSVAKSGATDFAPAAPRQRQGGLAADAGGSVGQTADERVLRHVGPQEAQGFRRGGSLARAAGPTSRADRSPAGRTDSVPPDPRARRL